MVDADIKSYFDTIPHDLLMDRIREKVSDGKILSLIELLPKAGDHGGHEVLEPY